MRSIPVGIGFAAILEVALAMSLVGGAARPARAEPPTAGGDTLTTLERALLFQDLSILAHDSMEGRGAGTEGIERARHFLVAAFPERGLSPLAGQSLQEFHFSGAPGGGNEVTGANVLGVVRGSVRPGRFLVISAHYDHLGIRGGRIYPGADDNASGTAALLALASELSENPPLHSVLFVAFDAEESGLRGSHAFVSDLPIPLDSIVLNVNLDMVSRSAVGELYAVGTHHYPFLRELVEAVAAQSRVTLLLGHDEPGLPPGDDWTLASDHGAFHQQGIPFIYFGVEDHAGYHQPTDTVENITPEFYVRAVETVLDFIREADALGDEILARRAGGASR
ncbi:MAG: M20/M25/M40 family metallo-hydrolase [Gemmatimonadetes bacterium]|nr:M20/M25/M40 family metallo-hydrolase [Gemmatimonadota bacterium]